MPEYRWKAAVVTLSDKGYAGEREDKSGPLVREMIGAAGYDVQEMTAPERGPKSKGGGDFVNNYEVMYIVKPVVEEEAFEAVVAKFESLITANGGTVEKTDRWGKKRLAYEIQDFTEGQYVLVTFSAEPKAVKELDRVMKITDEVMRHMVIKKGE